MLNWGEETRNTMKAKCESFREGRIWNRETLLFLWHTEEFLEKTTCKISRVVWKYNEWKINSDKFRKAMHQKVKHHSYEKMYNAILHALCGK